MNNKLKKNILSIWNELYIKIKAYNVRRKNKLSIMSLEDTINYIHLHKCSISRYGDGEFDIMLGQGEPNFQKGSSLLSAKLLEVFINPPENLLICVPQAFIKTNNFKKQSKKYWDWWTIHKQEKIVKKITSKIGDKYQFGDSYVSRPYTAYKSKKYSIKIFKKLKKLWDKKDVLIVEGEFTRLGVGNDLFSNAHSIKRILAPSQNAFDCYDEILDMISNFWNGEIVIIALGPTATILASDLAKMNIQALDLGHIDIQYQWFLNGKAFTAVEGKFANESNENIELLECKDIAYNSSIISHINENLHTKQ